MRDDLAPDSAATPPATTALVTSAARVDVSVPLSETRPVPHPRELLRDAARLALDALDEAGDAIATAIGLR